MVTSLFFFLVLFFFSFLSIEVVYCDEVYFPLCIFSSLFSLRSLHVLILCFIYTKKEGLVAIVVYFLFCLVFGGEFGKRSRQQVYTERRQIATPIFLFFYFCILFIL